MAPKLISEQILKAVIIIRVNLMYGVEKLKTFYFGYIPTCTLILDRSRFNISIYMPFTRSALNRNCHTIQLTYRLVDIGIVVASYNKQIILTRLVWSEMQLLYICQLIVTVINRFTLSH